MATADDKKTITHELGCLAYLAVFIFSVNMSGCGGAIGSGLLAVASILRERPCACECAP